MLVEHEGAPLVFDPPPRAALPPGSPAADPEAVALITWQDLGRVAGTRRAAAAGARPRVVAAPEVARWLGDVRPETAEVIEGVRVEALPYTPIPWATPTEALRKLTAALRHPLRAGGRVARRLHRPAAPPRAYQLTFPDRTRLVHLGCALHANTDPAWLDEARARFGGADWMLAGVDYEDEAAVLELLPSFRPRLLLLTDLINAERASLGLPTRLLTPTVDRLIDRGLDAHPFAAGATYRFS